MIGYMVNKELLAKAEEKLTFAEYLARPGLSDDMYNSGALKHAIDAGKLAAQALIDLKSVDSPRAVQLALMRFDEEEPKKFAKDFIKNWQALSDESCPGKPTVRGVIKDVQTFTQWITENQIR